MKNVILLLLTISLSGCFGRRPNFKTGLEGKAMPSFNLLLMDSTQFNTNNISPGQPVVLFLFSPECPYCRAQTKELIKDINFVKNIRFYLISNFPFESIKEYSKQYHLEKYSNITVGQDYNFYVSNYFKAPGIPYIAIYNKEMKLKQVLMGNVGTDLIRVVAF